MTSYWIFRNGLPYCAYCNVSTYPHYFPAPYCIYCGCRMENVKKENDK